MAVRTKVPILLLTGFLGTGKTSNLRRWLRDPNFAGAMVIVNELGEVGLDHQLVASAADVPLLLDNGCACCQASEDLVAMLEQLFFARLHRRISPFSWVLIETTGVADPVPITHLLQRNEIVATRYDLAGVVTTFDAQNGEEQLQRHPEVRRQLESASVVLLTKCDLAGHDQTRRAHKTVASLNGSARVLTSSKGNLPAADLLTAIRAAPSPEHTPAHHREGRHDHDRHAIHSEGITTAFLPLPSKLEWPVLEWVLSQTLTEHGPSVLRLKGVVELEGSNTPHVIQAAAEGIERTNFDGQAADQRFGLTIIANGVPAAQIALSLSTHLEGGRRRPALLVNE